ncbi:MAG: DUF362 domain-containing protein [bacterium]|nr:DUF362 domain-containing protein [bacterium]
MRPEGPGGTCWGFTPGPADLWSLLAAAGPALAGRREFIVKVNWFTPDPGNFTGPVALDRLLAALPGPAMVVEGHSCGRTDGSRWVGPGQATGEAREWLREQEREFLRGSGVRAVLDRYAATYLNVTEEVWAGRTVEEPVVARAVGDLLTYPELLGCVPRSLYARRGQALFINFARLKLPRPQAGASFSLGLKNLFGLIPEPARTTYHADLPGSVLAINRIYHALFDIVTVCEGLENVVVSRPGGTHRTAWGDYDLLATPPLAVAGTNPLEVDAIAAGIFGVDIRQRALFGEAARVFPSCSERILDQARSFGRENGLLMG